MSDFLPSGFPTKSLRTFFFSPMRATRFIHLTLLGSTVLMIAGQTHKSRWFPWSTFCCNIPPSFKLSLASCSPNPSLSVKTSFTIVKTRFKFCIFQTLSLQTADWSTIDSGRNRSWYFVWGINCGHFICILETTSRSRAIMCKIVERQELHNE